MYIFGFAKDMGKLRDREGLLRECWWITLRKQGEMIPNECVIAWVRNAIGQWDCLLPGLIDTPTMYHYIAKEIERLIREMREADFLKHANPFVDISGSVAYVFAPDETKAALAVYETGLRVPVTLSPPFPKKWFRELIVLQHEKEHALLDRVQADPKVQKIINGE